MAQTKIRGRSNLEKEKKRMGEILALLTDEYPGAECSLKFESPFQLLVATILSAQCTDARVNQVTPGLFSRFPTAYEMSKAPIHEIEKLVQSTGFFRSKALSIQETSRALVEIYQGEVPRELEKLVKLRGVGRKTANVVLGVAFGIPGLVVDTHIGRLSRRLGFTAKKDPVKVEVAMGQIVPREAWVRYGHLLIQHGRKICTSRRAWCEKCVLQKLCPGSRSGTLP